MVVVISWDTPGTLTTVLDTQLNGLTNGQYSAASAAITNESGGSPFYQYMGVELSLATYTPTGNPSCLLFLQESIDGTNFSDGGGSVVPSAEAAIFTFTYPSGAGAKRKTAGRILIPPFDFKLILQSNSAVALAGSGNTLKIRLYNERSN